MVYVTIREQEEIPVYSKRQAQVGALLFDKTLNKVPAEYSDYSNIFLAENAVELPENTGMNKHAIQLEKGKQRSLDPIYSLGPVKLETLKTYIKTNLANGFIRPSKFPAGESILFDRKPDRSFRLCVDYWGLINMLIKNRYPLPLIGELLDWLSQARRFI